MGWKPGETVLPVTRCRHCDDPIEYVMPWPPGNGDTGQRWLHVRTGSLWCDVTRPHSVDRAEPRYR